MLKHWLSASNFIPNEAINDWSDMSDEQFSAVQFELCVQCSNTVVYCEFREQVLCHSETKSKTKN